MVIVIHKNIELLVEIWKEANSFHSECANDFWSLPTPNWYFAQNMTWWYVYIRCKVFWALTSDLKLKLDSFPK